MFLRSRYIVPFLTLTPMLCAQLSLMWLAHSRLTRRWQKRTAEACLFLTLFGFVAGAMSGLDFADDYVLWIPRAMVAGLQSFGNLWGAAAILAVCLWWFTRILSMTVDRHFQPERRRFMYTVGNVAIAAPVVITGFAAVLGRTDFQIRQVDMFVKNLPVDLQGLRILHLSDIHRGAFLGSRELKRVIDMSNELRPSLAFVTGDLITSAGDPVDECLVQLARLRTDAGILGCLGNHEAYAEVEDYVQEQGLRLGIEFLRGTSRSLHFGNAALNVAGVDYQPFAQRGHYLPGADALRREGEVNVLLSHNPDVFPTAAAMKYDLTFAGHTHGGQVTVEILKQNLNIARMFTPYVSGAYRIGDQSCYVTRGIGTLGIPARLGAPPEITLVRLTSQS